MTILLVITFSVLYGGAMNVLENEKENEGFLSMQSAGKGANQSAFFSLTYGATTE